MTALWGGEKERIALNNENLVWNLIAPEESVQRTRVLPCRKGSPRGLVILLISILLSGCVTPLPKEETMKEGQGQVTIYLNGPEQGLPELVFDLASLSIVADDGTVIDIESSPVTISSAEVAGSQRLLGEKYIGEGAYKEIIFHVDRAVIRRGKKTAQLALPPEGITARIDVKIGKARNTTIFLEWDSAHSVLDGYLFSPVFGVHEQHPNPGTALFCVSNEGSNNVTLINRSSGEVAGTVLVGEHPRGIAVGPSNGALKVYVANAKSNSFSVINPVAGTVETEVPVRFGSVPVDIALVRLANRHEMLYTVNNESNTVSIFDPVTFQEVDVIKVGNGPVAVAADPPLDGPVDTRFLAPGDVTILNNFRERNFFLYVANRNSSTVSVLKMNSKGDRAEEIMTLAVGWEPVAFAMDYQRGRVYVANRGSDMVSMIDIIELIKGNAAGSVSMLNDMGYSTIDIVSETGFDRLYLLSDLPGEITMVRPPVAGATGSSTPTVVGRLPLPGSPRSMALDPETGKLFVVDSSGSSVAVIDKVSLREEKRIPVGTRPYDIEIISATAN